MHMKAFQNFIHSSACITNIDDSGWTFLNALNKKKERYHLHSIHIVYALQSAAYWNVYIEIYRWNNSIIIRIKKKTTIMEWSYAINWFVHHRDECCFAVWTFCCMRWMCVCVSAFDKQHKQIPLRPKTCFGSNLKDGRGKQKQKNNKTNVDVCVCVLTTRCHIMDDHV